MDKKEKEKMDKFFEELIKDEVEFSEELGLEKNEHGVYIYGSSNKNSSINVPMVLQHYKEWLIEKGIVRYA
jgi:hypothetical protein